MAVPKKKRYKQIVRLRRSFEKINILKKHKIVINNYSNFTNVGSSIISTENKSIKKTCGFCWNGLSKSICLNCYIIHIIGAYMTYKNYHK